MTWHDEFPWHLVDTDSLQHAADPTQNVFYLLGFAEVDPMRATDQCLQLMEQLRIESKTIGSTIAWFKRIDQREFIGDAGTKNLADLNWLTPRVLAHEAVVARLCDYFTFYPSRFGCLFSSLDRLSQFAVTHRGTLQSYFRHVRDRQEWGIKFVADIDQATRQLVADTLGGASTGSTGSNYLKVKHLQRTLRPVATEKLQQMCQAAIEQLQSQFELVVRPRSSAAVPDREFQLRNIALLLTQRDSEEVIDWCQRWNERVTTGVSLRAILNGPWPPYSFCPSLGDSTEQRQAA